MGSTAAGVPPVVVATTIEDTGPGAGYVPIDRTYDDGTVKQYTYQADGITVDTLTITRPGSSPVTYQANYNAQGVRTGWTEI
jgi:hypothetical protein